MPMVAFANRVIPHDSLAAAIMEFEAAALRGDFELAASASLHVERRLAAIRDAGYQLCVLSAETVGVFKDSLYDFMRLCSEELRINAKPAEASEQGPPDLREAITDTLLGQERSRKIHEQSLRLLARADELELSVRKPLDARAVVQRHDERTRVGEGMAWQQAKAKAEQYVKASGYPGLRKLTTEVRCSKSTLRKAIDSSQYLTAREAEHKQSKPGKIKTVSGGTLQELIQDQADDKTRDDRQHTKYRKTARRSD